ncbi:uncharacterized protein FOMMEDRAFT_166136 [Fomitiporia mediterranea MF3/22]|uniref:uncharacterized protein n=1 Tax=Fomitiporia mediterranea (strain MF3/22) TaxID=694068 RepID=UPI0004409533|nr:uncharacterized protein FOMMEDRAFT_166136 [Fomitiporia mediterranea MF3/22]EJD05804.1 hypothetical protein FOMMEDRAFT_166136 [Fomitiporia mediterranea MF3/22]
MTTTDQPPIVNVHTPSSSFAVIHSFAEDNLTTLFGKLDRKVRSTPEVADASHVGSGWVKYDWNGNVWNLDDESDYTILAWRQKSLSPESSTPASTTPTLYLHNPSNPLPTPPAYCNPSFYAFKPQPSLSPPRASNSRTRSVRSGKSGKSIGSHSVMTEHDGVPQHKKDFLKFHNENGVRTVMGCVGPVKNVRMLLKNGYSHVYISRAFAKRHGFIPKDATPGLYGYGGLVNIGQWPITVGKTKTMHSVYLAEESHFDCILGRSFMEVRSVKLDPTDPTNVLCLDNNEQLDCELVIIRDGNGEIVTVT